MDQYPRKLSPEEILDILNAIEPPNYYPEDLANMWVTNLRKQYQHQLMKVEVEAYEIIEQIKENIVNMTNKALISAGSAVGVISGQSIGQPVTQLTLNCLDYNELIYVVDNNTYELSIVTKIGDFVEQKLSESDTVFTSVKTSYSMISGKYSILSVDNNGQTKWRKIIGVSKHLTGAKLLRVVNDTGRSITASYGDSFLVLNDEFKFVTRSGSELKVGDIIPQLTITPDISSEYKYVDLSYYLPKDKWLYGTDFNIAKTKIGEYAYWSKYHNKLFTLPWKRPDSFNHWSRQGFLAEDGIVYPFPCNKVKSRIPDKIPLDSEFGFLIGIFLAEGTTTTTQIAISNHENSVIDRIRKWCDKYTITHKTYERMIDFPRGFSREIRIYSTLLTRFLRKYCGHYSYGKYIPNNAIMAPKEFIVGLLDGYFSGDGTINTKEKSIYCSSASEQLIDGIALLLTSFGIYSKKGNRQAENNNLDTENILPAYTLNIRNKYATIFSQNIKFTHPGKAEKQKILLNEYLYPYGRDYKLQIAGELMRITDEVYQEYKLSRDIRYSKITYLQEVGNIREYSYDLEVEDTKTFCTFNGFFCMDSFHNSGAVHEVLLGIPRVKEILNVTDDPKHKNAYVYFKNKYENLSTLKDAVRNKFIYVTLESILSDKSGYTIEVPIKTQSWMKYYKALYTDDYEHYGSAIIFHLDTYKMFSYGVTLRYIKECIENEYEDLFCFYPPNTLDAQVIKFYVCCDIRNISYKQYPLNDIYLIYLYNIALPDILDIQISGISGISNMFPIQEKGEWLIRTEGTNLPEIYCIDIVDRNRTYSDDIWEMYQLFGMEAVKNFLYREIRKIIGHGINERHIRLLLSSMTYTGTLTSVSRHGITREEAGPFGKASLEEAQDNLIRSGIYGETENNKGVSASITSGKLTRVGTGFCDIMADTSVLTGNKKKKNLSITVNKTRFRAHELYQLHKHSSESHDVDYNGDSPLSVDEPSDVESAHSVGSDDYYLDV